MDIRKCSFLATLGLAGALCLPVVAQSYPQDQPRQHDQDDQNRADRNRGYGNQNSQLYNTKAYQKGIKDGRHDRDKNKGERANKKHWKNDRDRQAYEAGYNEGYRGSRATSDHDRDDQRHDH